MSEPTKVENTLDEKTYRQLLDQTYGRIDAAFEGMWPNGAEAYIRTAEPLLAADTDAAADVYETTGFANRGTFLVDRDGIVRFAEMNGPGEGRDADDWRSAIKSL